MWEKIKGTEISQPISVVKKKKKEEWCWDSKKNR